MSNFYGKRFLSALMGALTVLGSSVASAGKRRAKEDTLDSGKTSSRRRTNRNVKRRRGRKIKADREAKGISGLRAVLRETGGKIVDVVACGKRRFSVLIETPAGKVTVLVGGVSSGVILSYFIYTCVSGGKKTDDGGQSSKPDEKPDENPNNEKPNENPNNGNPKPDEKPKKEPEVVNYKVMSDLLSGEKMEEYFLDCLFGKVFPMSFRGNFKNSFNGEVDKYLVDLVAYGFGEGDGVVISLKDKFDKWYNVCSTSSFNEAFYLDVLSDKIGGTREVSWWLSKFIANRGNESGKLLVLNQTPRNFLKLIFLTCWYYAFVNSKNLSDCFSVGGLNQNLSENGKKMEEMLSGAWDAISKYVDYLFDEAEKKKKV